MTRAADAWIASWRGMPPGTAPGILAGHGCLLWGAETRQRGGTSRGAVAIDSRALLLLLLLRVVRRLPQQRMRTNSRRRINALCTQA